MAAAFRLENVCSEPNSSGRTPGRRVRVRFAPRFVLWLLIQSNKQEQNAFGCVQGAAAPTGRSGRHWAPRGLGESIALVQQQIWRENSDKCPDRSTPQVVLPARRVTSETPTAVIADADRNRKALRMPNFCTIFNPTALRANRFDIQTRHTRKCA